MTHPNLYIIAGPNGAGKTTASYTLLPEMLNCINFVNADEIARGLSPFSPGTVDVQAARIMIQRIDELLEQKADFAIETTLATRSYVQLVKRAQSADYKVHLLFFCLESPEQAIQRVAQRVKEGGHNVPADVIRRRFQLGISNLVNLFIPICDSVHVWKNTLKAQLIAEKKEGCREMTILDEKEWKNIKNYE